jgi:hypothetical protein
MTRDGAVVRRSQFLARGSRRDFLVRHDDWVTLLSLLGG